MAGTRWGSGSALVLILCGCSLLGATQVPGCCTVPPGEVSTSTDKVCCRSNDCTTCPSLYPATAAAPVPTEVLLQLEPVSSSQLCSGGAVTGAGGLFCSKNCNAGSSEHVFVHHNVVTSTVAMARATCDRCCVLGYDTPQASCTTGCYSAGAQCFQCSPDSPRAGAACPNPLDLNKCRVVNNITGTLSGGFCQGRPCDTTINTFNWNLHESLKLQVRAPSDTSYAATPSHSGLLIMHYRITLEPDRETCCPPGLDSCCGTEAEGEFCNFYGTCSSVIAEQATTGSCSANCDCPFNQVIDQFGAKVPPATDQGDVACWHAVGLSAGKKCNMMDVRFALGSGQTRLMDATGFSPQPLASFTEFSRSPPPNNMARISGAGLEIEVELAAKVKAGSTYAWRGLEINVFDPASNKKSLMCPEVVAWPLKPTNAVLRTYVVPGADTGSLQPDQLPTQANSAVTNLTLAAACSAQRTCETCTGYDFNGLRCEWAVDERECSTQGTGFGRIILTNCGLGAGSLVAGGNARNPVVINDKLIAANLVPAIIGAICGGCFLIALCYNFFHYRYRESLKADFDREKEFWRHEGEYEEERRGDESLLPKRKYERDEQGFVDHEKEVMARRLADPNTAAYLMDEATYVKHLAKYGVTQQHAFKKKIGGVKDGRRLSLTSLHWKG